MKRSRVHILGASGSGTTTLATALADYWAVPHADADDYFWVPTAPPFRVKRREDERRSLMREVFVPREAWVLSGSMMGWGEDIVRECDAVVFLTLDPTERLRRLEAREALRRADAEVDDVALASFLDWARGYDTPTFGGRSRVAHEAWLEQLSQPVLRLDSARSKEALLAAVLAWDPAARRCSAGLGSLLRSARSTAPPGHLPPRPGTAARPAGRAKACFLAGRRGTPVPSRVGRCTGLRRARRVAIPTLGR